MLSFRQGPIQVRPHAIGILAPQIHRIGVRHPNIAKTRWHHVRRKVHAEWDRTKVSIWEVVHPRLHRSVQFFKFQFPANRPEGAGGSMRVVLC